MLLKRLLGLLFLNYFVALNYGYPVGSEILCFLPEALLSCVDKKVSKEATGGEALNDFLSLPLRSRSPLPRK